jgi:hypothetical protein
MIDIEQVLKDNRIKVVTSIVTFMVVLGGALVAIDERYAHAADLKEITKQLEINRLNSEVNSLNSRKSTLEDKIIEQAVKKKNSPADQFILERYKQELTITNDQIKDKSRLMDELRTGTEKKK